MARRRVSEQQKAYAAYKEDVQRRGKPFYPFAMFHDTVMSVVVVSVIVALACIWYFTSGEEPGEAGVGWLGPRYSEQADPGTITFIPRPDWYFFFLFYLLRIFHWPESVILATIGVPTLLMILLFALPFLDRRRERRPMRRPVAVTAAILTMISMAVLTYRGGTVREAVAAETGDLAQVWIEDQGMPEELLEGAELFAGSGCMGCHIYRGAGSQNVGAPELTTVGARLNVDTIDQIIHQGPGAMPSFTALGDENIRAISEFLAASTGEGGG